jgi:hypothetical protein
MNSELFPTRRADGSFSVAAKFASPLASAGDEVNVFLAEWLKRKTSNGIDLNKDFIASPHVEIDPSGSISVVLDAKGGSEFWKDWLVELTGLLTKSIDTLSFLGFFDRVSGKPHPASLTD